VPLVEIVSAPDLRSAEQARAYVAELRAILVAIGISDARMEEGSLRMDANVSVRVRGSEELGTRCEIKNLNSLRSLGRAIDHEAARQVALLEAGEAVRQETRHWDESEGRTSALRSKEEAYDYRYFPEPDLVAVDPSGLDEWQRPLPPLPAERRTALARATGAPPADVAVVVERGLDTLVVAAVGQGAEPGRVVTHAVHDLAVAGAADLDPRTLAALVAMESEGSLTPTQAKTVLADLVAAGGAGDPAQIAAAHGFEALSRDCLEATVAEVLAAHPAEAERLRAGDHKLTGFFVGKVMAATKGRADGKAVTAILRERLPGK
jgi:aspartyl-tRNA(Asn)/glutamyl-tRNA(Gln) amidotransferase subunit B